MTKETHSDHDRAGRLSNLALVLGGGGARAAYQIGFLRSLARAFPDLHIPIISGVSAGAINAAYLANYRGDFQEGVRRLSSLWEQMTIDQIFHADPFTLATNLLRWSLRLVGGGTQLSPPTRGFVDTAPLRRFLYRVLETTDGTLDGVSANLQRGRLKAAGIITTNYATAQSITWAQGENLTMWKRPLRRSIQAKLTVEHVMASCALPMFFPAIQLGNDWHGDGGVRLTAPLSPALHLGAERIIAISTRYLRTQSEADRPATHGYPPPATVIGVLLNAVFLDMLDYDELNLKRINRLVSEKTEAQREGLRTVELLVLRPSRDLDMLASDYEADLPRSFRFLTRGLGTRETKSPGLLATLLFTPDYIQRTIEIGEQDADLRCEEVAAFLSSGNHVRQPAA